MAWPRLKSPRSSAQPGSPPQITATLAAAAEPAPGHGQNTGISGASHSVADYTSAGSQTQVNGRRLRPIRFAHSGFTPAAPVGNPAGDYQPDDYAADFYGVRPAEAGEQPIEPGGQPTEPGEQPAEAREQPANRDTAPPNEGLRILDPRPIWSTEVPAEEPDRDVLPPREQPPAETPDRTIIRVTSGPSGATWNQPLTSPPRPIGGGEERQRGSFGIRVIGLLRGPAPQDGGQPRKAIRDLPPDIQLRFWRIRLLIMLGVGLVSGILTMSWEIGLTLAILAGITDSIYRARNAAHYDNGATFPGARRRTSRQLRRMRRAGYLALDARPIPNSREFIDHLVIGPTGVYAIDSEKWDRRLPVRTQNGVRLFLGPASQKERLEHALWEASQASEILSAALGTKIDVRAALAIYGPKVPWDIATIRDVDVFTGTALRKYLKRRRKAAPGTRKLSRDEVRTYYATAARVLPEVSPTKASTPVG